MEMNLSCTFKGTIAIIFGLLALILPEQTLGTFGYLFGAFIIAGIVIFMFLATTSPGDESTFWFGLTLGLVLVGVVSIFFPGIVSLVFLFIVAGVAFYSGFSDITYALEHPKTKYVLISGMFLIGILLLGVLIRFFPITIATTSNMASIVRFIFTALGSFALVFGICSILIGIYPTQEPVPVKPVEEPMPKSKILTFGDGCNLKKKEK
jgi:uncharacterized membrane protein HdeD (DUF308 family)